MKQSPTFDSDIPDYEPEYNTPEEAKKMGDHMESVSPKFKAFMEKAREAAKKRAPHARKAHHDER